VHAYEECLAVLIGGLKNLEKWELEEEFVEFLMSELAEKRRNQRMIEVSRELLVDALTNVEICFLEHVKRNPFFNDKELKTDVDIFFNSDKSAKLQFNYPENPNVFVDTAETRIDDVRVVQRISRWIYLLAEKEEWDLCVALLAKINYNQVSPQCYSLSAWIEE
jgi:hypothetical protein